MDSLPAESEGKPKNTGVGSLFLLQGIFLAQESNLGLLQYRWIFFYLPIELSGKPLLSYKNIFTYIFVYVYICICSGYYLLSSSSDMISKYFLPFISLFNEHTFLSLQSHLSVFFAFIACALVSYPNNHCQTLCHGAFPLFAFRSFKVLDLCFRS